MNSLGLKHHIPGFFSESFPDSLFLAEFAKGTQPWPAPPAKLGTQAKVLALESISWEKDEKETCLLMRSSANCKAKAPVPNAVTNSAYFGMESTHQTIFNSMEIKNREFQEAKSW